MRKGALAAVAAMLVLGCWLPVMGQQTPPGDDNAAPGGAAGEQREAAGTHDPGGEPLQRDYDALTAVSQTTMYIPAEAYLPCRMLLPKGYRPSHSYPLVIGLHGFGSNLDRFATTWFAFDDPQFIMAVPQAPYTVPPHMGGGHSWLPQEDIDDRRLGEAAGWVHEYVQYVRAEVKGQLNISDVYLLGFSQGGVIAYQAGIANHELFDGLVIFGSMLSEDWLDEGQLDAAANSLPVFLAHGTTDEALSVEIGQESRDILREHGYDVEYHEFDGGHTLPADTLQQVQEWITARE